MSCATHFDPTTTDCLSRVDFDRHLVFNSSGNGAHFDRCAYIIDLAQHWFSCLLRDCAYCQRLRQNCYFDLHCIGSH